MSKTLIAFAVVLACMLVVLFVTLYADKGSKLSTDHFGGKRYGFDLDTTADIFYINLDRRPDRRKHMEKAFADQGLAVTRHPAVDAKQIVLSDPKYDKHLKHTREWYLEDPKRQGHFACFLSHMEILKECASRESPFVVIFEDDAQFLGTDFKDRVHENMQNVPDDWDIVLCGYHVDDSIDMVKKGNKDSKVTNGIINLTYFTGCHGYIVRNKALPLLTRELDKHEWLIDWNIGYLAERGQIKVYGIFPPILCQPAAHRVKLNGINLSLDCSSELGGMMD